MRVMKGPSHRPPVAIVMPLGERRGGAERCLYDLIATSPRHRALWHVFLLEPGPLATELRLLGARVSVIPAGRLREPHHVAATIARLTRALRTSGVRTVVAWMAKAQLYAGPAAALAGIRSVWFQHGIPDPPGWLDRIATAIPAASVLACSEASARAQARLHPHRPTSVVYPGVDLSCFDPGGLPSPAEARRLLGLPVAGPVIGTVGRLQRWKGMQILLEALPSVLRCYPQTRCVLVGGTHALEPDVPEVLRRRAEALGVTDRVIMSGSQENVPLWMQAMDVFVHASDREPFGLVVVEAMALGKPVVAGAEGGPSEVITSGRDGTTVPFGDAAGIAEAVLRYLRDPDVAAMAGRAARARALDFSAAAFADRLLAAPGLRPDGTPSGRMRSR
jgi:glycosyltransferase involved in cell wall biosynthesis